MKAPLVERVSNLLLSELKKWDGVTNHGELMQLVPVLSTHRKENHKNGERRAEESMNDEQARGFRGGMG